MKNLCFFLGLCTFLLASGCQRSLPKRNVFSNMGGTFHQKSLVLNNIPLPKGFELADTMEGSALGTFCFGSDTFRYGEFLLQGTESLSSLMNFYTKQLPAVGWKELDQQELGTSARLRYHNPSEICTLMFREVQGQTLLKIVVEQKKS